LEADSAAWAAWRVAAGAALYAFVVTSFVAATCWTTAANAILLQYTSPLWIAALGWTVARERPLLRELIALLPAGREWRCAWGHREGFARDGAFSMALAGDLLALASGLTFALLTLLIRGSTARRRRPGAPSAPVALQCLV
jgi:drug/metabolite transporter (DMT)-like permease